MSGPARPVVVERLRRIATIVRRRLVLYGGCAILTGGVASLLTIISIDFLVGLPAVLRVLVGLAFLGGFIGAVLHWIATPLGQKLGEAEIAARLERHFPQLNDRLASTVNFLSRGEESGQGLGRLVVLDTERAAAELPLESVLNYRPLIWSGGSLVLAGLVLSLVMTAVPAWFSTGLYRYIYPFGEIAWPTRVEITPLTGNKVVAVGDSTEVRLAVDRGLTDSLRAVVHLRDATGKTVRQTMRRATGNVYVATIDAVTGDLQYWFEAGDAESRGRPATIRAVRRPEVLDALVEVEPPGYAAWREGRVEKLGGGAIRATVGGNVTITATSSKPVVLGGDGGSGLVLEDESLVPFALSEEGDTLLAVRLPVDRDLSFSIRLRDEHGFNNHGAMHFQIEAVADRPPAVRIVEPVAALEVTPDADVAIAYEAVDDFGFTGLRFELGRPGGELLDEGSLLEGARLTHAAGEVRQEGGHELQLGAYALVPGDRVDFLVAARDNFIQDDGAGQLGRSEPARLTIVGAGELNQRAREELDRLEERLRVALLDQVALRDRGASLKNEGLDPIERRRTARATADGQFRAARSLREIAERFRDLEKRMSANRVGDKALLQAIAQAGEQVGQAADGPVTSAGEQLYRVDQATSDEERDAALDEAASSQETAIRRLRAVLDSLGQWGDFATLVSRTRGLLERQEGLRREAGEAGKKTLGRNVQDLEREERQLLERLAEEQKQLLADADRLLARMEEVKEATSATDEASADAIDAALRAARSEDLQRRLRDAATAVEENRLASATVEQKGAADALRRMDDALQKREQRELERLLKNVVRAEELVAELLAAQKDVKAATEGAAQAGAGPEESEPLAMEQRRVRRNAEQLGPDLAADEKLTEPAALVSASAEPMATAERALFGGDTSGASAPQESAIELLTEALDALSQLAKEAEETLVQKYLDEIREELAAIADAQKQVNAGLTALREAVGERGRLGRPEAREASRLAGEEQAVRELMAVLLPDLEKVPVYHWSVERVAGWAQTCFEWLTERKIDDELVETGERITAELARLIEAIDQTQARAVEDKFAEAESAGDGGGQGASATRPIPTVAELLVLRSMQVDIRERTLEIQDLASKDAVGEAVLRQMRRIAEDQSQVRDLAQRVTARARR